MHRSKLSKPVPDRVFGLPEIHDCAHQHSFSHHRIEDAEVCLGDYQPTNAASSLQRTSFRENTEDPQRLIHSLVNPLALDCINAQHITLRSLQEHNFMQAHGS